MSQLHDAAGHSIGDSEQFSRITWPEFVQIVLKLTVRAYQAMRQNCDVQRDWEENVFTVNLAGYLRPIGLDKDLPVYVHPFTKRTTEKMRRGEQATIESKEMDIILYGGWEENYHKIHFVWEAKRVGDKRQDAAYRSLNSEYVNEAIYRFIRGEYAGGLDDAGVLGYVLDGDAANIVNDINQSMGRLRKNQPLPPENHLQLSPPVEQFEDIYRSQHVRTDASLINLHHLFLTFDFT